jgi:mannose/fructose/N-acetylgalactosamine-specific phosphotransferase system component IIC
MNAMPGQASSEIRRDSGAVAALVLGLVSLPGLVFPPLFGVGVMAIILGWTSRRRIAKSGGALKGKGVAIAGLALGVLGCLLSLVFPAFIAYVWIYAAFHNGQLPP